MRFRPDLFADHYSQPRLFYRSQQPIEQAHIASAIVFELSKVSLPHVRERVLSRLVNIDADLAGRVAAGLAMDLPAPAAAAREPVDMPASPALSILAQGQPGMAGRTIAILFAEGSNLAAIVKLKGEIEAKGGHVALIAPKVGGLAVKGGTLAADGQLAGSPSVLFDTVASIIMPDAAKKLASDSTAHSWFADAYANCKTIGACPATKLLLEGWGIAEDGGIVAIDAFANAAPARHWLREPGLRLLA